MGDKFGNYKVRRAAVGRYLVAHSGIPTVEIEPCGHILAPWGRTGWVTSSRIREVWAREVREHSADPMPYFVVQRIGDWDLDDSMVHMSLRHLSMLLEGYYEARHKPRMEGVE